MLPIWVLGPLGYPYGRILKSRHQANLQLSEVVLAMFRLIQYTMFKIYDAMALTLGKHHNTRLEIMGNSIETFFMHYAHPHTPNE